ncbi:hypothetical protein LM700948_90115 [Listeria monocytogenes]|nr:hypothetical protein LM700948_90115 [Listeria monocytogenes]
MIRGSEKTLPLFVTVPDEVRLMSGTPTL